LSEVVASTTVSIPADLEPYRTALNAGLYKLRKGVRPKPCELGTMKLSRINLDFQAKDQINDLLGSGDYKTQSDAIRDALLILKQGPAWLAQAKF
jgi:hypothetical protein